MNYKVRIGLIITAVLMVILGAAAAIASESFVISTPAVHTYKNFSFFAATTTSATSTNTSDGQGGYFPIAGAKKVSVYFSRGGASGANTGTSTFSVQVSPDAVTWYNFSKLVSNTTNTNGQTLTRVSSVAIEAATSTTIVGMDLTNDTFYAIRCVVVETIDGEHTCSASAEY